jgi:hypothetical protein
MNSKPHRALLVATACLPLLTGCTTGMLWEQTYFAPAREPHVQCFAARDTGRLLVVYDERVAGGGSRGRKAYYADSTDPGDSHAVPAFVPLATTNGMAAVAFVGLGPAEDAPAAVEHAVVGPRAGDTFLYFRDGAPALGFRLPYYFKPKPTAARVALTPLTVVADSAAVAGVTGAAIFVPGAAECMLESFDGREPNYVP